jgi:hypothetical protein
MGLEYNFKKELARAKHPNFRVANSMIFKIPFWLLQKL